MHFPFFTFLHFSIGADSFAEVGISESSARIENDEIRRVASISFMNIYNPLFMTSRKDMLRRGMIAKDIK